MNSILKTNLPLIADQPLFNSLEVMKKASNYFSLISEVADVAQLFSDYQNKKSESDFTKTLTAFYKTLQQNLEQYDNEFIIAFLKKYHSYADVLKEAISSELLKLSNQHLLTNISDSVGCLITTETLFVDSVVPLNDLNIEFYPPPQHIANNLQAKVRDDSLAISTDMSRYTTALYRKNLINVQTVFAQSSEAHGSNLITDFSVYINRRDVCTELTTLIASNFESIFKLVSFYSSINDHIAYNPGDATKNLQQVDPTTFTVTIEGTPVTLNIANQPVRKQRKQITNKKVLANTEIPVTNNKAVVNTKPFKSKLPIPLNSTVKVPQNNIAQQQPTPQLKEVVAPTVTSQKDLVAAKTKAEVDVTTVSSTIQKMSLAAPEFDRSLYPHSGQSPITSISEAKNLACTIKDVLPLTLPKLGDASLPKLPNYFKSFSFKNLSNPLKSILVRAEVQIVNQLRSLIPAVPKLPDFKRIFINYAKRLFACNPSNKS